MNKKTTFLFFIIFLLPFFDLHSQDILTLENKSGEKVELATSQIFSIKVNGYVLCTYDLKLIGDSVFFESNIYVDSLGQSELDFISVKPQKKEHLFGMTTSIIQEIDFSKYESRKYYSKLFNIYNKTRRNFYTSSFLVLLGGGLMIPGFIVPGAIVMGCGIVNHLIYIYRRVHILKTDDYDLKTKWKIVRN